MSGIEHTIELKRYGFVIHFKFNKDFSGFYWEALDNDKTEIGEIKYSIFQNQNSIFVETTFTPTQVIIHPIVSHTKGISISSCSIGTGNWNLRISNIQKSEGSLIILGARTGSYQGIELCRLENLTQCGLKSRIVKVDSLIDVLFIKKSSPIPDPIIISNIELFNGKRKLVTDESLIRIECGDIHRRNNTIIFEENAKIWSFFSVRFYYSTSPNF